MDNFLNPAKYRQKKHEDIPAVRVPQFLFYFFKEFPKPQKKPNNEYNAHRQAQHRHPGIDPFLEQTVFKSAANWQISILTHSTSQASSFLSLLLLFFRMNHSGFCKLQNPTKPNNEYNAHRQAQHRHPGIDPFLEETVFKSAANLQISTLTHSTSQASRKLIRQRLKLIKRNTLFLLILTKR